MPKKTASRDFRTAPLDGTPWKGHDKKEYVDLGLDTSQGDVSFLWLRKRLSDGKFFLVCSCVGPHIMRMELTEKEARRLFRNLPRKSPNAGEHLKTQEDADGSEPKKVKSDKSG